MIYVKYTPAKQTDSTWPNTREEFKNNYWSAAQLRALNSNVVKSTPHLKQMLDKMPTGQPLAPHNYWAKYDGRERVLGSDVQASQRMTTKGNRKLDRMRVRYITEYLITEEPNQKTNVELAVHVDTLANASQAFGYQGSFGKAQCDVRVVLPDGTQKRISSKAESRVRPAESEGGGGGGQVLGVGGSANAILPNMNPDGPQDDPKTEYFTFSVTQYPAHLKIQTNYRLTVGNFLDYNLGVSRVLVDHQLNITQGALMFEKAFSSYDLSGEPSPNGAAIANGQLENAPTGGTVPDGYQKAGSTPERDTSRPGTSPAPKPYKMASIGTIPNPVENGLLAELEANSEITGKNIALAIREGRLPRELAFELLES